MKKILLLLLVLLLLPAAYAKQGHMKLLAVSEADDGHKGGIADLYLEINPGTGRVFLETFPLTKIDTQLSTRFAKEIICEYTNTKCENYDFFYTITADSPIIAGPSAGAAVAVLTYSLLEDLKLNDDIAITGTINSGGLIGPVGGLKAKIEAGSKIGLKTILIPKGENIIREDNSTINITEFSKNLNVNVKEVSSLNEVIYEFTGKKLNDISNNLTINPEYKATMKTLAIDLCSRSTRLRNKVLDFNLTNETGQIKKSAINLTEKGKDAFSKAEYYSSASYCFGANVQFNALLFTLQNITKKEILGEIDSIDNEIKELNKKIDTTKKKTITDLEAYMVVKERLIEANEFLERAAKEINNTQLSINNLAYASERVYSAKSWAAFLDNRGKEFDLNAEKLKKTCQTKLSEVEERLQYVNVYFPSTLENIRKELSYAYKDMENSNYELCIFKASTAKADVDIILNVFGVDPSQVDDIVKQKLEIVKDNIIRESAKGIFPILGYSYYEYANSLVESDVYSALLYSEYALELSNLDIYFKDKEQKRISLSIDKKILLVFLSGLFTGILATIIVYQKTHQIKSKLKKKKRHKK